MDNEIDVLTLSLAKKYTDERIADGNVNSVNGCDGDVVLSLSVSEGVVSLTQEEV